VRPPLCDLLETPLGGFFFEPELRAAGIHSL